MTAVVGDIIRVTCIFQWETEDFFTNQFYWQLTVQNEPTDDAVMIKIADAMDGFYTFVTAHISNKINYIQIDGQNITQDILMPTKPWPVLITGGGGGDALPTQVAALVYYKTLRPRTRAGQYIPPLGELSGDTGGAITTTALAALQNYGDNVASGILELSVEAVLGAFNPDLSRFTPVTAAIVPVRFRTQRRRRLGVGS